MGAWEPLGALGRAWIDTYTTMAGPVRCTVVPLEGAVLVFSPGTGLATTASELVPPGQPCFLVAPSAGHTLGLKEWCAQYPQAVVVTAPQARARIASTTGCEVADLAEIEPYLPAWVRIEVPPPNRLGEVWVAIEDDDAVLWLVCDAFVNAPGRRGFAGLFQRLYRAGPGLEMTRLFVFNIADRPAFRRWVEERLSRGRPVLVPCHGHIDSADDLGQRWQALVERRL